MYAAKQQGRDFNYLQDARGGGGGEGYLNSCHSRVEHAKEHDAFVDRDSKSGELEGEGEVVWRSDDLHCTAAIW